MFIGVQKEGRNVILGNMKYAGNGTELTSQIRKCLSYATENELLERDPGSYEIEGKDLFVNIVSYETTVPEKRFWEAHRQYLDVHLMLEGTEEIDLNFIDNLVQKDYVPDDDFLPLDGKKASSVILSPGDFIVCYPEDAHMTAVQVEKPGRIKKAIFKIKI